MERHFKIQMILLGPTSDRVCYINNHSEQCECKAVTLSNITALMCLHPSSAVALYEMGTCPAVLLTKPHPVSRAPQKLCCESR